MPALLSSLPAPVIGNLAGLAETALRGAAGLLTVLATMWLLDRLDIQGGHHRRRLARPARNLVIAILRLAGATSVAAALRYHARRHARPLRTIMKC